MSLRKFPLIPVPASVEQGEGTLVLPADVLFSGDETAVALLHEELRTRGVALSAPTGDEAAVVLRIDASAGGAEAYRLTVGDKVEVVGADAAGLFYGVQTLVQLVTVTDEGIAVPRVTIADAPRYAYRGAMLDVARHFFDVAEVKAYIDRVSALKFNHLHLHLTDDQGWRIQIDSWPLLTEKAAASSANGAPGGFYTKDDFREIVTYAASRHMTIVPEIDLPGHTHAVGVAYPEIVEAPVLNDVLTDQAKQLNQALPVHGETYTGWGVGHSSVRIHEERTYDFVRDVLTEVAELAPGPYLHIGGDEALGTPAEDFALFIARASGIVREIGKTPMAWHEAGAAPDLAEGTVLQYWGSLQPDESYAEKAAHFFARGGRLVLSPSDAAYLDMKYSEDFPLGLSWAGYIPVQQAYSWEPTAVVAGVKDDVVLGIEAPLWTETVSSLADAEQLAFPRAAAIAEVAWSPASGAERTWESFRERLARLATVWDAAGQGYFTAEGVDWKTA